MIKIITSYTYLSYEIPDVTVVQSDMRNSKIIYFLMFLFIYLLKIYTLLHSLQ
jgi:hypothetical protein